MKRLLLLLLLIISSFVTSITAVAQDGTPVIRVSPVKASHETNGGKTVNTEITVTNPTSSPISAAVEISDFMPSNDITTGEPRLLLDGSANQKYGLRSWLTSRKTIQVGAGRTTTYTATFAVPRTAAARTYFGAIRFIPNKTSGEGLTASVGTLVFITVGDAKSNISINEVAYQQPSTDKPYGSFTALLHNQGEARYTSGATVQIKNEEGEVFGVLKQDIEGSVLPESSRQFSLTPHYELPQQKLIVTAEATGPDGTKVTKEMTLDLSPVQDTPPAASSSADPARTPTSLIMILGGVGLGIVLLVLALLIHRRKSRSKQFVSATPISAQPTNDSKNVRVPSAPPTVIHPEVSVNNDNNSPH